LAIMSSGRLVALGGGRRALLRVPVTDELALMEELFWGSETVRKEGTRRGKSPCGAAEGEEEAEPNGGWSELELGGPRGVLASEEVYAPGDPGVLSSSGVTGRSVW
jgi:hypothetical protein